jgi:predicted transcriptional regulator
VEVDFSPEMREKLEQAAEENGAGPAEFVQELVVRYLDHDAWFRQKVHAGLEQLDAGQFLTHEEIGRRLAKRFPA